MPRRASAPHAAMCYCYPRHGLRLAWAGAPHSALALQGAVTRLDDHLPLLSFSFDGLCAAPPSPPLPPRPGRQPSCPPGRPRNDPIRRHPLPVN